MRSCLRNLLFLDDRAFLNGIKTVVFEKYRKCDCDCRPVWTHGRLTKGKDHDDR